MILNLVDRRRDPSAVDQDECWVLNNWQLLASLAAEVGPVGWAVDLVMVDDSRMAGLNEGFRAVTGVTDVLSFSYLMEAGPAEAELVQGCCHAAYGLKLDESETLAAKASGTVPVVGEIILAPGFIHQRCLANEWPISLEFPMLVVHGLLHVLGWDHLEDDERQAMQDIEESVLANAQLTHPLRRRS